MVIINVENGIVNFNGLDYLPTNLLSDYIEQVDSTGCFIELNENQYRIIYNETLLNDITYNNWDEFSSQYLTLVGMNQYL